MPILDRVKLRTETDLPDLEIQSLIDEANQDIVSRYGQHSQVGGPITVMLSGDREMIVVQRDIDITQTIVVTEYLDYFGVEQSATVMASDDYRIWPPFNNVLQRFSGGTHATIHWNKWGDRVKIDYTPVDDGNQREEVMIKLVILAIQYDAFKQQAVGDVSGETTDYVSERNKLLMSIAPRRGLDMA